MTIRHARPEDARAIAAIHVRAWQAAYRGIVPSTFLDDLSIDRRESGWRRGLEQGGAIVFVAEENGQPLGWVNLGPSRDADAGTGTGELYALYVAPEHWRRGVGYRLISDSEKHLSGSGFTDVTLWVLSDNSSARAFYGASGFALDAGVEKMVQLGGAELREVRLRHHIGR